MDATLLTDAEIREGIARLTSSALIKARPDSAGDLTGTFKVNVGVPILELRDAYGIDSETACVIFDLAVALVTSRLSRSEIFTLGTSEEAMRLFEAECEEWNDPRRAAIEGELVENPGDSDRSDA
jgi:hypothetical protein